MNFIVRAVDDILKDTFGIAEGLADHKKVTVLDFAAGTGTFLLEVMQRIFDNIGGPESGKAASVVREHMLQNLYGFEYLIAPYTIAHLKLSQYLKDKGHPLHEDERLQVFLTNTLEPIEPQKSAFLPELSNEVEQAQKIKEKPILVILGNPPYSGHSKNKGAWITSSIAEYRKGFPELCKPLIKSTFSTCTAIQKRRSGRLMVAKTRTSSTLNKAWQLHCSLKGRDLRKASGMVTCGVAGLQNIRCLPRRTLPEFPIRCRRMPPTGC
ncbi:MAG: hypothetical protein H0T56_09680 [Pseudaminobacter sp.]|nr:hypothetical protein [Pseudaminobacter sp.]